MLNIFLDKGNTRVQDKNSVTNKSKEDSNDQLFQIQCINLFLLSLLKWYLCYHPKATSLRCGNFENFIHGRVNLLVHHKGLLVRCPKQSKFELTLSKQALVFTCLLYKSFENTVRNGEIAHNEQFFLFPQRLLLVWKTFRHFHQS